MDKKQQSTEPNDRNISITGNVVDSVVIAGDNNTVNQTIIQKFFNIFKSDTETLEQRNRRILLGHVENAWIKGVLDASLHGAALLDLGIKQDPDAVTKYPWTLKKESTDETLPAGTSMLEIFDSIGMGRSLLILGAPGSGKTTMLLELARGLISRAREDITQPIPMVFNLASWTEKLTLADWLAQELNNLYSVPRKTAPDWVKGNKLLLLLDGLDEVRQESRAKCVEAINEFRKQNGLTSLSVCSRSQDYADLKAKLAFEGAIEVQPLTQGQIAEFFNRFGDEMAGIKQALEKDSDLREMAETPLFLSIMIMAYRGTQNVDILVSKDEKTQRKHLFGTYIECIFERPHVKNIVFNKQGILHWLSWLAHKMIEHNQIPFRIERIQPVWLLEQRRPSMAYGWVFGLSFGLVGALFGGLIFGPSVGLNGTLLCGLFFGLVFGMVSLSAWWEGGLRSHNIHTVDLVAWNFKKVAGGLVIGLLGGLIFGLLPHTGLSVGLVGGLIWGLLGGLSWGLKKQEVDVTTHPGEKLYLTTRNLIFLFLVFGLSVGLIGWLTDGLRFGFVAAVMGGFIGGWSGGGVDLMQHYTLRFVLSKNNLLPWRLVPFLDHCVDLIFLRRVGGGYIFIHRLLMEHFAEMYVESPTSKGN